jgi:hypothetical protein
VNILPIKNLAPVKPLFSLADNDPAPDYLCDALRELLKDKLNQNSDLWRLIADTTETTSNFIQGKQHYVQTTNGWKATDVRRTNPNRIACINTMQYYCTQNLQRIVSSNPDVEPAEEFRQVKYKEKVKKNKAVWNYYERKFYQTWLRHQQALHCIISGNSIESVQYDHLAQGSKVFKEIWGEKEVQISEGSGQCFSCSAQAPAEAFGEVMPQCPECGSQDVHVESAVNQIIPSIVGMQPIQTGDLTLRLIPIQAVRFDPKVQLEESSWMIERSRISQARLNYILGKTIKWGEAVSDRGLDSVDSIAKAGNTLLGQDSYSTSETTDEVTIDRMSLKPEDYAHIRIRSEETVSGETLPEGKMAEIFPNGVTLLFSNEKELLGLYPDVHHSQEASSGVFHMRLQSGVGRGSEDTVEVQKRFNRADAQMVRSGESGATPGHWFIEGAVDRKHVKQIGIPGMAIPIKKDVAMASERKDLIGQIPPSNIAGTYFQYNYEILDKYRQMVSHAPDVNNGLTGGNKSNTATEAQISDSNSEALYGPILQILAAQRKSTATKTIALYAKHFKGVSRSFTHGTTSQGIAVAEQIKGEDVDPEIEFVVVANSERPKTRFTQQQALASAFAIAGGAEGFAVLKQSAPDLLNELLKTFDLDLSIDDYDTIEDLCWKRLQQVCEVAKQYEQETQGQIPLIPEIILLGVKPQIRPTEPYHGEKATWFSEYLDTPDAQDLSETERDAIDILIMAHRNGGVIQMGNLISAQNEAQMAGQQPVMEQQMAMQQQQMQAEAEAGQGQVGMEMQAEQQASDNQMAQAEADREFQALQMMQQQQQEGGNQEFQRSEREATQDFEASQFDRQASLEREKMKSARTSKK